MAQGILDTLGLMAIVVLAIPVGLFGVEHLVRGEMVAGVVYLGIAVGMVVIEQYLTTPTDLPGMVAEKTVGAVVKTEDPTEED
ncbi:DUF7533 family protein [Haloarcula pellucida]|uniref:Uncharacterized protein n=1 Tax=Haloarcula pellucida TaxID=1427151 RepID=A0A830GPY6_9EURY|nr:hypothetical protein [Halomicroarcula pellucida]MBX0349056.1 hypothetical protein [Halomicroarcula pellucida]GGN98786.1 hypothetical protein GCM10009030_29620 [Halomicroarcula pellucida]